MASERGPPGGNLAVRSLRRDTRLVRGRGVPIPASEASGDFVDELPLQVPKYTRVVRLSY